VAKFSALTLTNLSVTAEAAVGVAPA